MIDLSKVDIFGNETRTINTSNCYIIRKEGDYCFPLVYGNGIKNGKDNKESYTTSKPEDILFFKYIDYKGRIITNPYIKDKVEKVGIIWKSDGIKIKNIKHKNNYLYFTIKLKKAKQGENALIGIYDEEGKIIWSWHIWFYRGELEIIPVKDKTKYKKISKHLQHYILSINLGWNGETNTFYQWGRKDPFRSDIKKISRMEDNMSIRISILNPDRFFPSHNFGGFVNLWDSRCDGYVDEGAQYPNHSRLSIKTIYDPCPPGFKVPGCDVFEELKELESEWRNDGNGKIFDNRIFLPSLGNLHHNNGGLSDVFSAGYYWSSASYSQVDAYGFSFSPAFVYSINNRDRADGFLVRPVKEYG